MSEITVGLKTLTALFEFVEALSGPVGDKLRNLRKGRRKPFMIPRGMMCVISPIQEDPRDPNSELTSRNDEECCEHLRRLLLTMGRKEEKDWRRIRVRPGAGLRADEERENLIIICGPSSNVTSARLLDLEDGFLENVSYLAGATRDERCFVWRGRRFRWDDERDFALFVIRQNPYAPKRRIILLFGLRDIGTLAAGMVYALDEYKELRKKLAARATSTGQLEVLLRVNHDPARRNVLGVDLAQARDGTPLSEPAAFHRLRIDRQVLKRIYASLDRWPRHLLGLDHYYELTITREYHVRMREVATWRRNKEDVFFRGKKFTSDVPLKDIDDLEFRVDPVDGLGEVVALPAVSEPGLKKFLLFPIPPITEAEPERHVVMSAVWPRGAKSLAQIGGTDKYRYRVSRHYAEAIGRLKWVIRFEIPNAKFMVQEDFKASRNSPVDQVFSMDAEYSCRVEEDTDPGRQFTVTITRVS